MTVMVAEGVDIRELLTGASPLSQTEVQQISDLLTSPQVNEFRRETGAMLTELETTGHGSPGISARVGLAAFLLGQHRRAVECLSQADSDPIATFNCGCALEGLNRFTEAAATFGKAGELGYDSIECTLRQAGAVRAGGDVDEAEKLLRSVASKAASRAEYCYQLGCIWSDRGDTLGAIEYFERAVDMDPHHSHALFRLATENSNQGNDGEAVRLYEQSLSRPPYFLGAMLNLGLLYEDAENYPAAAYCFRRVLDNDPNHARALLYLKDIEATDDMYYDEDTAREQARVEQLLSRPVTDFELSVRSRNCLSAMGLDTLGELTKITEQELLAGKNFGETSLQEIRELMSQHSLVIGQNLHGEQPDFSLMAADLSPQEQQEMARPISDLQLSVRARKCMSRLGITTIGELLQRTPDELLSSRNFGVTSLNEIRAKLGEMGMKLRND